MGVWAAVVSGAVGFGLSGPSRGQESAEPPSPRQHTLTRQAEPAEPALSFGVVELPERLTVGYAVTTAPIVGDERPDILIVDSKRIVALENPSWQTHVLHEDPSRTDNVCFAWGDLDGDGDLDAVIGADWTVNTSVGGTIEWLENPGRTKKPWLRRPITTEPTVHRMRLLDDTGDGQVALFVLPLMGRDTTRPNFAEAGVRFLRLTVPSSPQNEPWPVDVINDELHVSHNFCPIDADGDGRPEILVVSFEGISLLVRGDDGRWARRLLAEGEQATRPNRGASEIAVGKLGDGTPYLATVEPWHGDRIAVYLPPDGAPRDDPFRMRAGVTEHAERTSLWRRFVIDTELKWGHAVKTADLTGDGTEELIVGVRDDTSREHKSGVRIYQPVNAETGAWQVTRLDPGGVAVEDLTTADLNGDGRTDIVAVGRATKNVKIYFNQNRVAKDSTDLPSSD